MTSFKRSKLKTKERKSSNGLKLIKKSRKQIRKELRKQQNIKKSVYLKKRKELHARANIKVEKIEINDNKTNDSETMNVNKSVSAAKEGKFKVREHEKKSKKNKLLKQDNQEEDRVIKKLEKQLKLNKKNRKTISNSFAADGLNYLLDFCLEKDEEYVTDRNKELLEDEFNNKFNETCLELSGRNSFINNKSNSIDKSENESINKNETTDFVPTVKKEFINSNDSKKILKTEISKNKKGNDFGINNEDIWEDIYGRKRDKEGNIIYNTNKYIPPAIRASAICNIYPDDEKLHSLRKQLKGCLNRVTENNIYSISNQIEAMYTTNSRNNMNYVLSDLIFESLASHVLTPDRLISEYMMLIGILHANIGIEVGANFLEKLIKKLIDTMEKSQGIENKVLDNVVLMISHLYNFKLFGYKLLYQILNKFMVKFTEKEIELILLILKTVGFSLRKDNPNALKEFIQDLQEKASHENERNSRVKFMLEILLAIKNNNINKIPQYDPSHVEHLKKVMKGVVRKGNTIMQLNVSLEDLLHADENGKWWITGSTWSGSSNINVKGNVKDHSKLNFDRKILKLAEKQRMNTDTRRNIFCILITAEDYLDAFEKLHHLGLKDQQEGEIIYVLMHCCLQEKKFNPYYAVLAEKLCEYNRKYQLTIQYTFWDKLKRLETYGDKQLLNLAEFLIHLFIKKCLALSILKVIQFIELDKHTMEFVREIILGIVLHENEQASIEVFERISVSPQLQSFRESLRLFIKCFLVKNIHLYDISNRKKIMLKKRTELVDKILSLHGSRIIF